MSIHSKEALNDLQVSKHTASVHAPLRPLKVNSPHRNRNDLNWLAMEMTPVGSMPTPFTH